MTSHMQGEAVLTKSVKLLQKLSARQQAKLIKLLNKELIKQSDLVGQKSNELRQKLSEEQQKRRRGVQDTFQTTWKSGKETISKN